MKERGTPSMSGKRRLTQAQRDWCAQYEGIGLGYPALDDYHSGAMTFAEAAQTAVQWMNDHVLDHVRRLETSLSRLHP